MHPDQVPAPPRWAALHTEEEQFLSEFPPGVRGPSALQRNPISVTSFDDIVLSSSPKAYGRMCGSHSSPQQCGSVPVTQTQLTVC